jgi:hypothetical protein
LVKEGIVQDVPHLKEIYEFPGKISSRLYDDVKKFDDQFYEATLIPNQLDFGKNFIALKVHEFNSESINHDDFITIIEALKNQDGFRAFNSRNPLSLEDL